VWQQAPLQHTTKAAKQLLCWQCTWRCGLLGWLLLLLLLAFALQLVLRDAAFRCVPAVVGFCCCGCCCQVGCCQLLLPFLQARL
jgi:hypothetical protein